MDPQTGVTDLLGYPVKVPGWPVPFENTTPGEFRILAHYTLATIIAQAVVYALLPAGKDKLGTANLLLWLPLNPVIVWWALVDAYQVFWKGGTQEHMHQVTPEGATFMREYIALQAVGIVVEVLRTNWQDSRDVKKQLGALGHHLFSAVAYSSGLYFQRCHCFAVAAGLSEMSTIWLNLLFLTKVADYKAFFETKMSWLAPLSGVLLWLSFLVFRLLLFPYVNFVWVRDIMYGGKSVEMLTAFETFYYFSVVAFLFFLSLWWFKSIHRGMMKACFGVLPKEGRVAGTSPINPDAQPQPVAKAGKVD